MPFARAALGNRTTGLYGFFERGLFSQLRGGIVEGANCQLVYDAYRTLLDQMCYVG